MDRNGMKRTGTDRYRQERTDADRNGRNGQKWTETEKNGQTRTKIAINGYEWS